ncbi:hypothetical protein HDU92_005402 [Lobulomyces angularis]|nr:hypothetical protein HDU92_005402 [Lobulomyces angularis]
MQIPITNRPASINVPLQQWLGTEYDLYQWQINALYSLYSFPNIILPLIEIRSLTFVLGGYCIDKLGPHKMLLFFSSLVCIGNLMFTIGILNKQFIYLAAARLIFGLGGESLEVAQSTITTIWFRGRGLAFALSVNLSCARIATALNDNISPWISTISVPLVGMFLFECLFPNSFDNAGWVGFSIAFLSFLSGIALIYVDNSENRTIYGIVKDNFDKKLNFEKYKFDDQEAAHLLSNEASQADEDRNVAKLLLNKGNSFDEKEKKKRVRIISKPEYFNEDLENSQYCSDGPSSSVSEIVNEMVIYDYDEEDENIYLGQILNFDFEFWLLCILAITLYGSATPFFHICTDFFQQKWYKNDPQTAGFVMSIPDIVSAVGSPICGFLVDKVGKRVSMLIISSILVLATHVLLCFTSLSPMFSMTLMGLSFTIFPSAVWPCVPLLVSNHQVATAYGIVTVALNASLFGFPLIVAKVRSLFPNSFDEVQYMFMFLSSISVILSMYLYYLNKMYNGTLEESISEDIVTSVEENSVNDDTTLSRRRSDDWLVTKVVAEGLLVFAPRTLVHHNHSSSELISSPTSPIRRGRSTCLCHSDHIMQENAECNNEISHVLRRNKSRSKTPVRNANLDNETE